MTEPASDLLAMFSRYLETAEKVSDRRAQANTWLLSVNSALVALYGYLGKDGALGTDPGRDAWFWAIPGAGILVCVAWTTLLASYRKLNAAKFKVLISMEQHLPHRAFHEERTNYKEASRLPLSTIESLIPCAFLALYVLILFFKFRTVIFSS